MGSNSVLISGASSGIGEACARLFAREGYDLVLVARREDRLQALGQELSSAHGVKVETFGLDVRSNSAVARLVSAHPQTFERVGVLINNAGLAKGVDPVQDARVEDWDAMIDTNVKGLLHLTRAILPVMVRRRDGHVINIGSVAGQWVYPKGAVYCATKAAVRALTQGLRQDLHGTGLRVSEIAPGMVETDFSQVRLGDRAQAEAVYRGMKPLSAEDIAEAVLWCVQRPKHVNVQEVVIFPTAQSAVGMVDRELP